VFGHKHEHDQEWTHFGGIVADSRLHHHHWTYVVDYRRAEGGTFRVTVPALPDQDIELRIGTQVQLEVDLKSGEARLVPGQVFGAGGPGAREAVRLAVQLGGAGDRAAAVAAALGNLGQLGGPQVHISGNPEVRVIGGSEVRVVGGAQAAEVMAAVQDLMSGGDPAAARERIRHLKADLQAQAGMAAPAEPAGFSSPEPSTFDSVTPPSAPPAASFSSPDPTVGQPGPAFGQAGPAFGQQGFSPVAPATTFSSPDSTGAFGAGGSAGSGAFGAFGDFGETKSDRIARLEDQRDRGQITPEEFAAQRQQIQDEI
jgi:hypothetical protein